MNVDWREAYELRQKRAQSDKAVTGLRMAGRIRSPIEWLLRNMAAFVTAEGAVYVGVETLADRMGRTPRYVWMLVSEALTHHRELLELKAHGGGCHRTNRYMLKIGPFRDDPNNPHMQRDFAERWRRANESIERKLYEIYCEHLALGYKCCRIFAPREVKEPPIEWAQT